jgi:hypothetical protein
MLQMQIQRTILIVLLRTTYTPAAPRVEGGTMPAPFDTFSATHSSNKRCCGSMSTASFAERLKTAASKLAMSSMKAAKRMGLAPSETSCSFRSQRFKGTTETASMADTLRRMTPCKQTTRWKQVMKVLLNGRTSLHGMYYFTAGQRNHAATCQRRGLEYHKFTLGDRLAMLQTARTVGRLLLETSTTVCVASDMSTSAAG